MDSKLNILIVEDDVSVALDLEMILEELGHLTKRTDSADGVFRLLEDKFDVIIMDIYIKGKLNGIQIAEQITDLKIPIIFITSYRDKSLFEAAKNTNALAFLVKPFDNLTLRSALELKFPLTLSQSNRRPYNGEESFFVADAIFIKSNSAYHKLLNQDILWVQADLNYAIIHTIKRKRYILKKSLATFKKEIITPLLIQIHKGYLVNLDKITKVDLTNNQIHIEEIALPLGRTYRKKLIARLNLIG